MGVLALVGRALGATATELGRADGPVDARELREAVHLDRHRGERLGGEREGAEDVHEREDVAVDDPGEDVDQRSVLAEDVELAEDAVDAVFLRRVLEHGSKGVGAHEHRDAREVHRLLDVLAVATRDDDGVEADHRGDARIRVTQGDFALHGVQQLQVEHRLKREFALGPERHGVVGGGEHVDGARDERVRARRDDAAGPARTVRAEVRLRAEVIHRGDLGRHATGPRDRDEVFVIREDGEFHDGSSGRV